MKVAICDDERKCVEEIIRHLNHYAKKRKTEFEKYAFPSAEKMLLSKEKFDIAFLDIQLPNMNGIELGKKLKQNNPHIHLIYITAHSNYLDDALNINTFRFFEKPITPDRFYSALDILIDQINATSHCFYLKDGTTMKRVYIGDIVYIEIENRKTKIITYDNIYYSSKTMKFWKDLLLGDQFDCPHNSFVVNLNYITAYVKSTCIILSNKYIIPVSRTKRLDFNERFNQYLDENNYRL